MISDVLSDFYVLLSATGKTRPLSEPQNLYQKIAHV